MQSTEMARAYKLPLLPGNGCSTDTLRTNFRKPQLLGNTRDREHTTTQAVPLGFGESLKVTRSTIPCVDPAEQRTVRLAGTNVVIPASELNSRVLRYYAYFREAVTESGVERERVRRVVIQYYLEDGTMSVTEPRVDNSGIVAGSFVRRHRIPTQDGQGFVTFNDLAVGEPVTFYGRTYYPVDCDAFTRDFCNGIGVNVPDALPYPHDAHTTLRGRPTQLHGVPSITATATSGHVLSRDQIRACQQFLRHDREVLRCEVLWDDREALYGEQRFFTLYYFLADDTVEVVEQYPSNSGRDPFPSFVRRQRMPKPVVSEGGIKRSAVSTVSAIGGGGSLTFKGASGAAFYTPQDLTIGSTIDVFGRPMLIYNYNAVTREYLETNYGIKNHTAIEVRSSPQQAGPRVYPPYNGWGSEEDSLASCKRLDIKPPKRDMKKLTEHARSTVKFTMKLDNNIPSDDVRVFVLTYHLADDTVSIFEPVVRNSGVVGGKFLQRQQVKNPATGENFKARDFFVGARPVVNGFQFVVLATDERSLSYMEAHPCTFSMSDIATVARKFQAMLLSSSSGLGDALRNADLRGEVVSYDTLLNLLRNRGMPFSEQEVLTILRYAERNGDRAVSLLELASRFLPEGLNLGCDGRPWEALLEELQCEDERTTAMTGAIDLERRRTEATTAAYAARALLEAVNERRTLFEREFNVVGDYTRDGLIGSDEFVSCCTNRLKLPIEVEPLRALAKYLFPSGHSRIPFLEFMRLVNGTSNLPYNLAQIAKSR